MRNTRHYLILSLAIAIAVILVSWGVAVSCARPISSQVFTAPDTLPDPPVAAPSPPPAQDNSDADLLAFYEALANTTTTVPLPAPPPVTRPPAPPEPEVVRGDSPNDLSYLDAYWDRMAQCETGGNWAHFPDGTWTGGLGIYNQTWLGWGGGEFAPKAGQATREQQIIVANRIATGGYGSLGPVGYSAWGCARTIGYP